MNDLDRLMALDPLELSAQDIDKIIEYQRQARKDWESGVKPKKAGAEKQKLDLVKLGITAPLPVYLITSMNFWVLHILPLWNMLMDHAVTSLLFLRSIKAY